ncbi:hypothetical protein CRYUN_Cryun35bG0096600 [Craigia yunnanensis]
MASVAIDVVIGRIVSAVENEASTLGGVQDEIDKIKLELMSMISFLEEADRKGTLSEGEKTWVANVRNIAYEVEDAIDEFMFRVNKGIFFQSIHIPKHLWLRHQMANKLQKMKSMIQAIPETVKRYGIERLEGIAPNYDCQWVKNHSESSLFFDDDNLVGIETAKQNLMRWLLSEEPQRTVTSVFGMGGLGKTTLVANTFNSKIVRQHFDCYAWLTISQTYILEDLFKAMIQDLFKEAKEKIPADLGTMRYRQLVELLVNYLQQKRYVVVLDDVWSISLWREICVALPDGMCGSRIMLTTRRQDVACFWFGIGSQVYQLRSLPEAEAWKLFCMKAFSSSSNGCYPLEFDSIARALVEKFQGLPLAIVALGGMMSSKKLEHDWKKVYNSLNWELSNNPELKILRSILLLSFNDLPIRLKRCFLYCCLFPESYKIKRKRLIRLWMAEGFIEQVRGATPEEVADNYLMELISRSMLQVVLRNYFGRPKACKMHDIVREISLSISEAEKFCIVNDKQSAIEVNETRRLSIQCERKLETDSGMPRLRSFLVFTTDKIALPSGFKFLRTLDLENASIDKLPTGLVNLFNLRYLNLAKTSVRELPRSIGKLHNLQTLNIKHTEIEELPAGIVKLQNLRYLITFRPNRDCDGSDLDYVLGTRVPPNICKLKNLQVLDCVKAEDDLIKQLCNMTQLRRISLVKVKTAYAYGLCIAIENMKLLRFLALAATNEERMLHMDNLSSAPPQLEKLFLSGKLKKAPHWFNSLQNLTYLGLRWSKLGEDLICCVQALPKLAWLSLFSAYEGEQLRFFEGFQKLQVLEIINSPLLTKIIIEKGVMPGLQKLYLRVCTGLKTLPCGIDFLSHLQELHLIIVSPELVESIRARTSMERAKVQHIPMIKHYFRTEFGSLYESL